MIVKAAVLQYDVPEKTKDSFVKLGQMVEQAAKQGAKLVVAPETAVGEGGEARDTGADYFPKLSAIAKENKVFLATSFYKKGGDIMYNQGYIVGPNGQTVIEQKKIYPAKPEVDNLGIVAGNAIKSVNSEIGCLGMLVCKDGFNPYSHYLYEKLGTLGTEIICIPAWSIGWKEMNTQEYVKSLYVYGAFASRSFVLMSDCTNKLFNSYGRSLIVSPIRGILKEGSTDQEEILIEDLDLDEVKRARKFDSWWQPKEKVI